MKALFDEVSFDLSKKVTNKYSTSFSLGNSLTRKGSSIGDLRHLWHSYVSQMKSWIRSMALIRKD